MGIYNVVVMSWSKAIKVGSLLLWTDVQRPFGASLLVVKIDFSSFCHVDEGRVEFDSRKANCRLRG